MVFFDDKQLYDHLISLDLIDRVKIDTAYRFSVSTGEPFAEVLIEKDLIAEEDLTRIMADMYGVEYVDLAKTIIEPNALKLIPEKVAIENKVVAFKSDQKLHLALINPNNLQLEQFINQKTGLPTKIYLASRSGVGGALAQYQQSDEFIKMLSENVTKARLANDELSVINLVNEIITDALRSKASDIHLEPTERNVIVRFRTDGVLHDIVKLPLDLHQRLVTRIKVLSGLRTDEHVVAQDGNFHYKGELSGADIRVSIVPTTTGETISMRLLTESSRRFSLTQLGIDEKSLDKIREAYNRPFGMLLATGPTGSGKTTTMYAILKLLNTRQRNIMTIEDPVEYRIEGVSQIQVNAKTNLTFGEGLKSIVRQDPDIVLVGEIRDQETAKIAVNAAMTGHLVLSTLHTNDAATTIPRLLELDVEPFLVASSLNVIVAQRLVRQICPLCRVSQEVELGNYQKYLSPEQIEKYFDGKTTATFYRGKGCPLCFHSGYLGRVGIFEVLEINERIRNAIMNRRDASTIKLLAIANGMDTMFEAGLRRVQEGVTTLDEVIRVIKD